MFWRMLMTIVAVLAFAVPAAAQQKAPQQPLPPSQAAGQQVQQAVPAAEGQPADQQPPTAAQQQPTAAQQQPLEEPTEAEVAVTPPADMKFLEVQDKTQFLADEEVIGKDVVNVMEEEVGTIADLVMDRRRSWSGRTVGRRLPRRRRQVGSRCRWIRSTFRPTTSRRACWSRLARNS